MSRERWLGSTFRGAKAKQTSLGVNSFMTLPMRLLPARRQYPRVARQCNDAPLEATCYYSISGNPLVVTAHSSFGEEKRLAYIDMEAPVDKDNTDRLYCMSTCLRSPLRGFRTLA